MVTDMMKKEKIKVRIFFGTHKAEGEVITHEGYRGRLSDILNDTRVFLNLNSTTVYDAASGKLEFKADFICINKRSITVAMQID